MGNAPKNSVNNSIPVPNNYQNQDKIIINNRLKHNKKNKTNLDNKNKKGNLDLFRNINDSYDINETQKIGNEEIHEIKIKNNNFINESNNINFLKTNKSNINKIENNKNKQFPIKGKVVTDYNNKKDNLEPSTIRINPNLYEFTINNYQYLNFIDKNKNLNKKNDEILSSEVTINITNSEGEFFFDNIKKEKNNDTNKNNILFNNLKKYENKKSNNINNKQITNYMQKLNYNNNEFKKEKNIKNKIKIKIDDIKYNDIKNIKNKEKNKNNNNILKISNTNNKNNNNCLIISNYLNNKNHSRNKRNKSNPSCRINSMCNNQNKINKIHNNFSFKDLSNNIVVNPNIPNIKSYKENNKLKLSKKTNNQYMQ